MHPPHHTQREQQIDRSKRKKANAEKNWLQNRREADSSRILEQANNNKQGEPA